MSDGGSLKRVPATSFRAQRRGGKGVKTQDDIPSVTIRTNTVDSLMIFSNKGRMYRLIVNNIPEGTNSSRGTPVRALIEMEKNEDVQTIYSIYRDTDAKYVFLVTKKGVVKKVKLEELIETKRSKGLNIITFKDGDSLSVATLIKEEQVLLITKHGQVIRFDTKDITPTGRAAIGVKGMNLAEGDEVVAVLPIRNITDDVAVFTDRGYGKRVKLSEISSQGRGGKGVIIYKPNDENGEVSAAQLVNEEDTVLLVGNRKSICINVNEIPVLARNAVGVILLKDNEISSVSKV
jgi:DNA gyrase subunit A